LKTMTRNRNIKWCIIYSVSSYCVMTRFYVASFICSSVYATLTIFTVTSIASMLIFEQVYLSQ
jgi:hypothetical protein